MKVYAYPLIPFTIFVALGIVCNKFLSVSCWTLLGVILLLILLLFYFNWKTKKVWKITSSFGITTYFIAFSLGMFLQNIHFAPKKNNHYSHFIKTENNVKATVISNLKPSSKNTKHIVEIQKINQKKASGKLLVYIQKDSTINIITGTEIICQAQFLKPFGEQNPYQFNYANYLENNNIFNQIFIKSNEYKIVNHRQNWNYFWFDFQKKLADSFKIHNWNNQTQSVVNALLLGQRKLLDEELLTSYSDVGVVHILAISGLHVGIIYLMLLWILKPLDRTQKTRIIQFLITLFVLWSFAFITGFSASVSRAVLMFSLFAFGRILSRQTSSYNILATSALILLVYKPNLIFDIGFQMSYAAVLSIVSFNSYFKYFYLNNNKIIHFFTDILLVSVAAQIGILPISLYYFHQFSPLFLAANLVAIPLTMAILWLGVTTLVLNFIFPKLALQIGKILEVLIDCLNGSIAWFSHFKSFIFRDISFNFPLAVAFSVVVVLFLIFLRKKNYQSTISFLLGILIFQLTFIGTKYYHFSKDKLILFNTKQTLLSHKKENKIIAFSNNYEEDSWYLNQYKTGIFSHSITKNSLQNVYQFNNKRILIIDSSAVYPKTEKVDILILTQNPKLHLNRLISEVNPTQIIADNSNKFYMIAMWKKTCEQQKIPFHATGEKGFYRISN